MESFAAIGALMMCLVVFIVLVSALIHCNGKKEKAQKTPSKTPIVISNPSGNDHLFLNLFNEAVSKHSARVLTFVILFPLVS